MKWRRTFGRLIFCVLLSVVLFLRIEPWVGAQQDSGKGRTHSSKASSKSEKGKDGGRKGEKEGGKSSSGGALTLSKQIDPGKYILGPGDELTINLWGEYDAFDSQTVSAEGKISLPTIGELNVSGLSLEQAEALLKRSVEKYYRNVHSGLSLTALRTFKVAVLGAVHVPGSYSATLDTRMSDLIVEAGGTLPGGSLRHIQVKREGKIRAAGDLNAYLKRGVETANPFLQEGDVLFVPPVSGSVIRVFDKADLSAISSAGEQAGPLPPLEYELEDGQKFSALVYDLGGLNPAWDFLNIYVVRRKPNGAGTIKFNVDVHKLLIERDGTRDFILQNGDNVFFNAEARSPYLDGHGDIVGLEKPY